ncbi:hypothetical protein ES332_D06G040400v1 [Gossypium tomentosum]|uniref:Uncharacterized protein n=1 Tax=Gossypium tomentosum TaxID=34277 RepID=A0A5D2KGF7_GOSTO|nr:hypothetical protein ES332_D06G040400v1 [Gossypium tomentosum]
MFCQSNFLIFGTSTTALSVKPIFSIIESIAIKPIPYFKQHTFFTLETRPQKLVHIHSLIIYVSIFFCCRKRS